MNKVAIVTGAASGIGYSVLDKLVRTGWRVAGVDSNAQAVSQAAQAYADRPDQVRLEVLDITEEDNVAAFVQSVADQWGRIDGVVNSAGIARDIPFFDTTPEIFEKIFRVNVTGTFLVSREAGRVMSRQQSGAIVNVASVSGVQGNLGRSAYGASKGGVITLTKVMAIELASHGIRVNAIAPGPVETPLVNQVHTTATRQNWLDRVPQHRYGSADEIATPITFLLDPDASAYVTGQVLAVDGGFCAAGLISQPA